MRISAFYFDVNKLTDGELADLIHELSNELSSRNAKRNKRITPRSSRGSWLNDQLTSASLSVRSWSSSKQKAMKGSI